MQKSIPDSQSGKTPPPIGADDLQFILITLGARSFGLPLADVSYIAKMPSDFVSHGTEVEHHFVFEGAPLSYVSLWDMLNLKSNFAEYEEMQAMLPQRRQDHIDWMSALESSIRNGTPFSKARNPHECAFGKWFYSYRAKDRRLSLLLGQFEQPHAIIHSLADRLLKLTEAGHTEEALNAFEEAMDTTLAMLMELFVAAQELVVELQRRIAVIVSDGENTCALGADGVSDIVTITPECVKENAGKGFGIESQATSGLIVLENNNVVPLLNWHNFCAAGAFK